MSNSELDSVAQIRELVRQWHVATKAGDTPAVLEMMTEDAIFLTVGRDPMTRHDLAGMSHSLSGEARPKVEVWQDILEIHAVGDFAFMRSQLEVAVTPSEGQEAVHRRGHTLSVFRRVNGKWLLARDANLLIAA